MPRRAIGLLVTAALALAVTGSWSRSEDGLVWLATGDSFSSGEGIDGASGRCAVSDRAYPVLARQRVVDQGVAVGTFVHAACTRVDASGLWLPPPRQLPALLDLAEQHGLPAGPVADVITITLGGNEVGFADVIRDCAGFEITREALLSPGCSTTEEELRTRVDDLAAATLDLPGGRGAMADVLRRLADERLADGGHLLVVGYPLLFADPASWSDTATDGRCAAVSAADARMLNRVTGHLVDLLAAEVARADAGAGRIHFLDVRDRFPDEHRICGNGTPWINGLVLTTGETLLDTRGQGSYHPNGAGHRVVADAVADAVVSLLRKTAAPRG